ncbi:ABC transporter ATP-binding protein [Luteimonas arsenica]|uniref:ABC transporter ATP-binding protein n=1 Tax=Luteimonas arsenica TaxID=1586242 RepID=UPI001056936D|nr:ABC transporter ATP-binding protein [Luteimonas arsenica]
MSSDLAIRVRGVGKAFPSFEHPYQQMLHMVWPKSRPAGEFQALSGVSLDIRRGEAVGIIGRNGSGKSTLLQLISGILTPTAGTVEVQGRIAALLELGAGFNPEFTGRENILLNGSLLGLSQGEIQARMGDILAFAEIGDYVDQQVKTYSSGMFVRLAFAVAVHTDPDILIVDESLAVGDIYFQRKCHKRIEELRQNGCTLLFVTHAADLLLQLCDRGVVLDHGRLVYDGEARNAVGEYLRRVFGDNSAPAESAPGPAAAPSGAAAAEVVDAGETALAEFVARGAVDCFHQRAGYNRDETRIGVGGAATCDFLILGPQGQGPVLSGRERFSIHARYEIREPNDRLVFGMRVATVDGTVVYAANTFSTTGTLMVRREPGVVVANFDLRCGLTPGQYFVTLGVSKFDDQGHEIFALDRRVDAVIITVIGDKSACQGVADLEAVIGVADAASGEPLEVR